MHADFFARNIAQRVVDGGDDALDEIEEISDGAFLKRDVMLERKIRAIELKQEALRGNRLIFDLQRAADRREVGVLGVVVLVADRRHDDARGGGVRNASVNPLAPACLRLSSNSRK